VIQTARVPACRPAIPDDVGVGGLTAVSTTLRRRVASIDSDHSQTKLTQLEN